MRDREMASYAELLQEKVLSAKSYCASRRGTCRKSHTGPLLPDGPDDWTAWYAESPACVCTETAHIAFCSQNRA
jgi:hypothetical protein